MASGVLGDALGTQHEKRGVSDGRTCGRPAYSFYCLGAVDHQPLPGALFGGRRQRRERGKIWQVVPIPSPPEADKMTALSSIEYAHWLMIAGALLLVLGFIGLALRQRGVDAEPYAIAGDEELSEPEADLTPEEVYERTAKEKRRARWAESFDESDEPVKS